MNSGSKILAPVSCEAEGRINFARLSASVISTTGTMISKPPIVGVPALPCCHSGSSVRIIWPMPRRRRISTSGPPQITVRTKVIPPSVSAKANGLSVIIRSPSRNQRRVAALGAQLAALLVGGDAHDHHEPLDQLRKGWRRRLAGKLTDLIQL